MKDVKVNQMLYMNFEVIEDMKKYADRNGIKLSALVELLWDLYKVDLRK